MAHLPSPGFPSIAPPPARRARRLRTGLLAGVLALGVLAPAASAASGTKVVSDCADDSKLSKKYTAAEYADALKHIPTDVDEYTDCRDIIRRAQLGLGTGSGGGSGNGSSGAGAGASSGGTGGGTGGTAGSGAAATPGATGGTAAPGNGLNDYDSALAGASPADRAAITQATGTAPAAVQIGGEQLRSTSLGRGELGDLNSLPTPLVIVLLLLALGTLAACLPKLRTVVRTRLQRPA